MALATHGLLRLPDFRRLGVATAFNSVGMMGENVVLGWLTLTLTTSPFLVGVAMAARSLPLFFVGMPAGVLADRFPRHRLLMLTGVAQGIAAAGIGLLAMFGRATPPAVLLLTLCAGVARALEHAARQSYAHEVVGPAELMNGLAVLGVIGRMGWLA